MHLSGKFFIFFGLCFYTSVSFAAGTLGQVSINPKYGKENWNDTTFTIFGNDVTFNSSEETYGIGAEYKFDFGVSVGGELLYSNIDILSDGAGSSPYDTYANSYYAGLLIRYHLFPDSPVQPFIGGGLGVRNISTHSDTNISVQGTATTLNAGVIFHIGNPKGKHGAISLEYKRNDFDLDDENGARIEATTDSYLIGGSFNF